MGQEEQKFLLSKFIEAVAKDKLRVNIFLKVGTRLNGFVGEYDPECITLFENTDRAGVPTLVMRSSIASMTKDGGR